MMHDGKPKSPQTGTNGFTCMVSPDGTPLCADENAMAWRKAAASKSDPPNKVGFIYMLAGDTGTNNEAAGLKTHEHWVQTGPHVMIMGPAVREMGGYPRTVDVADPTQPYVMFPGTPYEHLMLPVAAASGSIGEADRDGRSGEPVLRAGGPDEVRQGHGTQADIGLIDRPISGDVRTRTRRRTECRHEPRGSLIPVPDRLRAARVRAHCHPSHAAFSLGKRAKPLRPLCP
jgi:hypothetical protein